MKVGAERTTREREIRPWKVAVVAESSIRVMGSSAGEHERKREDRERGRREKTVRCNAREKRRKRTVCSLDRIIAGGSGLTSSRITSTSPYLEPYPSSKYVVVSCSAASFFLFSFLSLQAFFSLSISLSLSSLSFIAALFPRFIHGDA